MNLPPENILHLIRIVKPALDSLGIDYWLGRGVLRQVYLTGGLGDQHEDVDFHIWKKDHEIVRKALDSLLTGFTVQNRSHKLAFFTPDEENPEYFIEFMFLFSVTQNGLSLVCHQRADSPPLCAPAECFSDEVNQLTFSSITLRVPNCIEDYLAATYGPRWRENIKTDKRWYRKK